MQQGSDICIDRQGHRHTDVVSACEEISQADINLMHVCIQ
jgi:hypothetical protein